MTARTKGPCARCQRHRTIHGRGLCWPCYRNRQMAGLIDDYAVAKPDRAGQIGALIDEGVTDRREMAARLGCTVDAVNAAVKRSDIADKLRARMLAARPDMPPWPTGPTPCAGVDVDLFFPQSSSGSVFNGNREQILDALSYCDRCPLSSREWCIAMVDPQQSRATVVAGGVVFCKGKPRPLPKSWAAEAVA